MRLVSWLLVLVVCAAPAAHARSAPPALSAERIAAIVERDDVARPPRAPLGPRVGAGDLLTWPDSRWTPADVLAALPHLPPEHGFRERFVYDNTLYIVAAPVKVGAGTR